MVCALLLEYAPSTLEHLIRRNFGRRLDLQLLQASLRTNESVYQTEQSEVSSQTTEHCGPGRFKMLCAGCLSCLSIELALISVLPLPVARGARPSPQCRIAASRCEARQLAHQHTAAVSHAVGFWLRYTKRWRAMGRHWHNCLLPTGSRFRRQIAPIWPWNW